MRLAPGGDLTLALAYYHSVGPALPTSRALDALFSALCQVSTTEAFYFARRQEDGTHRRLFEQLISYVLAQPAGDERARKAVELVNQPLTEQEEGWFEQQLTTGADKQAPGARDTLTMRRMATGRFVDALGHARDPSGRKHDGVNWTVLKDGVRHGLGPRGALGGAKGGTR